MDILSNKIKSTDKKVKYSNNVDKQNYGKIRSFKVIAVGMFMIAIILFSITNLISIFSIFEPTVYGSSDYQIIFMDNNLFYFCQLEDFNTEFVKCKSPYYLVRRQEEDEQGKKEEKVYVSKPEDEEIYQPEGPILLNKEKIVYISKIGSESSVLEYIENAK